MTMERLQKYLSRAGVASRRHAEAMIVDGRVKLNGKVITVLGTQVDPQKDLVVVDGKLVAVNPERKYFLFYKPPGVVTTLSDPEGRPTVGDYAKDAGGRVFPVGRLDYDAEGALLLTDDGDLANKLMHPSHQVPRVYLAKVKGVPDEASLAKLVEGVRLEDGMAKATEAKIFEKAERNTWVKIVVTEGRQHLVKRLCAAIGHPVVRLYRPAHAGLPVHGLRPGELRELTNDEIRRVKAAADGDAQPEPRLTLPARRHGHAAPGFEPEEDTRPEGKRAKTERAEVAPEPEEEAELSSEEEPEEEFELPAEEPKPFVGRKSTRPPSAREERPRRGFSSEKPGAGGGKPAFSERGPKPASADRGEDRAARKPFGERPSRGAGDRGGSKRSFGDRDAKPGFGAKRSFGDRDAKPGFGAKRSFGDRDAKPGFGAKRSFGDRDERGPAKRSFGDRDARGPAKRSFGDRDGAKRSFGDRDARGGKPGFGAKRSFGDRDGAKRSFGDRDERGGKPGFGAKRSFGDRDGAKRSFGDRDARGGKPGFGAKRSFGDRDARGSKPGFGAKRSGDREERGGKRGRTDERSAPASEPASKPFPGERGYGGTGGARRTEQREGGFKREGRPTSRFGGKPGGGFKKGGFQGSRTGGRSSPRKPRGS